MALTRAMSSPPEESSGRPRATNVSADLVAWTGGPPGSASLRTHSPRRHRGLDRQPGDRPRPGCLPRRSATVLPGHFTDNGLAAPDASGVEAMKGVVAAGIPAVGPDTPPDMIGAITRATHLAFMDGMHCLHDQRDPRRGTDRARLLDQGRTQGRGPWHDASLTCRSGVAVTMAGWTAAPRLGASTGALPSARTERGLIMLKRLLGLAGVGALLALVLACGFGSGGDDDDDDDDNFARGTSIVLIR